MKILTIKYSGFAFSLATLFLRLGLGVIMLVAHGIDKLRHFSKYSGGFVDPYHFGRATSLSLDIFAEVFCSSLLLLGLFTRLASIPLIFAMATALFFVHHGDIFGMGERAGLFLAGFVAILLIGPGKASLDHLIGK